MPTPPLPQPKILQACYALQPHIFVTCTLHLRPLSAEVSQQVAPPADAAMAAACWEAVVGVRRMGDVTLSAGLRLWFPKLARPTADGAGWTSVESIVTAPPCWQAYQRRKLTHALSDFFSSILPERRKTPRIVAQLPVTLQAASGQHRAVAATISDGSEAGLALRVDSPTPLMGFLPGRDVQVTLQHHDAAYAFEGTIASLVYDWRTGQHRLGVALAPIDSDRAFVLMRNLDPNYTVNLNKQKKVDMGSGKIRVDTLSSH
jgi:hypothetical protein